MNNLLVPALLPYGDKCPLTGERAMRIREHERECLVRQGSKMNTLSQLRDKVERMRNTLQTFEEREEKLLKCRAVLEEMQKPDISRSNLEKANTKRMEGRKNKIETRSKRRKLMNEINQRRRGLSPQSEETMSNQPTEVEGGNGEEEGDGNDDNEKSKQESNPSVTILSDLSGDCGSYEACRAFVEESKNWKKSSACKGRRLLLWRTKSNQIKELEDILRKLIEDLSNERIGERQRQRQEKQVRDELKGIAVGRGGIAGDPGNPSSPADEEIIDLCVEERLRKRRRQDLPEGSEVLQMGFQSCIQVLRGGEDGRSVVCNREGHGRRAEHFCDGSGV